MRDEFIRSPFAVLRPSSAYQDAPPHCAAHALGAKKLLTMIALATRTIRQGKTGLLNPIILLTLFLILAPNKRHQ